MKKRENSAKAKKHYLQKTLNTISVRGNAPLVGYVSLLALYFIAYYLTRKFAGMQGGIQIGENGMLPYSMFTGVVTSLANMLIIVMVVFYKKIGFLTALGLLVFQYPLLVRGIFFDHNYSSLPGVFTNTVTLLAVLLLWYNNRKMEKYQKRLREQAVTDRLTGLPNRFACSELVRSLIAKAEPFAVVTADLNNFKSINDTMGFNTGNEVLQDIAGRWTAVADEGMTDTLDFVIRLSGDEFVIIIRSYESEEQLVNSIKQYEAALEKPLTVDGCDLYIAASFGYTEYPADADTFDNLLSYSSAAMAEVKHVNSSNRILRFSPDLVKAEQTMEIERKLRSALEKDTIYFNLQPQFDLNHKLRGFEALARMTDENGQNVPPGDFIPVAEKIGLVDRVDGAVIRKSAAFFGELLKKTGADIMLSVNTSVRHLMKNDFLDEVREILRTSGVPAEQLEIEITESIMIDSADKAIHCIEEIKKMGIQIAIDDFGTGYSSLSYLNKFPANLLKIDKSFIDKMNTSDSSKQYVAAIISIGHIMGFDVISEGVEEPDQLETLHAIGCDFIQGFIWGRPLSADEAEELVMSTKTS